MKAELPLTEDRGASAGHARSPDLDRLRIERTEDGLPRRRVRWGLVVFLLLVMGGAAAAWLLHFGVPLVHTARAAVEVPEEAGGVVLTATGYVVARKSANVGSKIAGRIAAILVQEGDRVSAGQIVARLEDAEQQARAAEARANLADARRELDRVTKLVEGGAAGTQQADTARTRLDVAQAQLSVAEADLANTLIPAPFEGVVVARTSEVGETISFGVVAGSVSTGVIVAVADLSDLEVDTDVNETHVSRVREGQPADVVLDAYSGERLRGVVRKIMPRAVRRTSSVPVRVKILEPDARVRPEMSAKVFFGAEGGDGASPASLRVFVPASALEEGTGPALVRVVRGGRAFAVRVKTGTRETGRIEIAEGLAGGEEVVVAGGAGLPEGARVRAAGP